jgi:hypothetical protein
METRCNVIVEDQYNRIQLYRHHDGYPENFIPDFTQAFHYSWQLPRFEVDEFAAAIVRAWKDEGGGNIRIDGNPKGFELIHGDVEWVCVIRLDETFDEPIIEIYDWDGKGKKPINTIRFTDIPNSKTFI